MIPLVAVLGEISFIAPPDDLIQPITKDVKLVKTIEEIPMRRSRRAYKSTISND